MHAQVMTVTPTIASSWLSKNDKNRRVAQHHVRKLAGEITAGRWSLNGQSISFDENGRLLDGQHRLNAIILAGIPVQTMVVTGVTDPEAFKTYDGHVLKRGASQVAAMMGLKNSNNTIAIARVVRIYDQSKSMGEFAKVLTHGTDDSPAVTAEMAIEMADEIRHATEMVPSCLTKRSGWPSGVQALAVIFNRIDPVSASEFFGRIKGGRFYGEKDPCLQLRDRMMAGRIGMSATEWKRTVAAITIKSFNAFRKGKDIASLRWRIQGDNPERFPAIDGASKC